MPQGRFSLADIEPPSTTGGSGRFSLDDIDAEPIAAARPSAVLVDDDRQFTSDVRVTPPFTGPVAGVHPEARIGATPLAVPHPEARIGAAPPVALPPVSTRMGSAKTGPITGQYATTGPTIVGEGVQQMARGVVAGSRYYSQPTDDTLNAASDILEGAAKAGTPLAIAGAIVDLPGTIITLGTAHLASAAAGDAAALLGASPAAQRFTSALAGAAAALGLGGKQVAQLREAAGAVVADARSVAAQARAFDAANPPPVVPTEPISVGRGATPAAGGANRLGEGTRELPPAPETVVPPEPPAPPPPAPPPIDVTRAIADLATATPNSPEAMTAFTALQGAGLALDDIDARVQAFRAANAPSPAPEASAPPTPASAEPQGAYSLSEIEPVDEAGRPLGGYAGPDRRVANAGAPDGVERRAPGADVVERVQGKLAAGEPLGTEAAQTAFAERQRVDAARPPEPPRETETPPAATRLMGVDVEPIHAQTVGGVSYELYRAGAGGVVRVTDVDSGQVATLKKFPLYQTASAAHYEAIGTAQQQEHEPPPAVAPPTAPPAHPSTREPVTFQVRTITGKKRPDVTLPPATGFGAVASYKPGDRVAWGTAPGTVTEMLDPTGRVADRRVVVSIDGGPTKKLQLHLLRPLPPADDERKVEDSNARPPVPSDREPLAGAPPADGQEPRGEGTPAPSGGARREADGGGGERPDSGRPVTHAGAGPDASGVGVPPERSGRPAPAERRAGDVAHPTDHVIAPDAELAVGGDKTRVANNLAAIETLKRLEAEQRHATPDERETLAKYVGWGGLASAFKETHADNARLKAALTDEEYRSARASTPNAHYTSPTVIKAVYDGLTRMGVRGPLKVLEPAAGVGHFLGLMPPELAERASRHAVEMDAISGRITKALYPNAHVQVKPFEQSTHANDHYDLVISNVPFGNYQVSDKAFKGRPKTLTSSIHNYYFAKALDLVRPGGIVAFITSHYTLDAQDKIVREYLASKANLLAAIRLPNTAFKANAGTEVVTDIIFLQKKRTEQAPDRSVEWVGAQTLPSGHHVNWHFIAHPSMVLGEHSAGGTMYGPNEYTVKPTGDLATQLREVIADLPEHVYTPATTRATSPTIEQQLPSAAAPPDVREHAWFEEGGKLFIKENGEGVPVALDPKQTARVKGLLKIRDTLRGTMRAMLEPASTDAEIRTHQRALTKAYDTFVDKHGYLARPKNYRALREDPDVYTLLALEEWAPKAETPEKAAIFTKRTLRPHTPVTHVDTPKEALLVALNETGRVEWGRMAALTDQTEQDLQLALEGLVFQDPQSGRWEHADRYLSGNVKTKLQEARAAGEKFALNVQALEQVQPADLEPADIAVRLGSPWIPADVIDAFARHLGLGGLHYTYTRSLAKWTVNDGGFYGGYSVQNTEQWGTGRKPANKLLLEALNLGDPVVMDRVTRPDGSEGSVVNQPETVAAREKAQAQADEFKAWIWTDATRAARLARIYNDTMNTMRPWEPDGSHLSLEGTNPAVKFRPHQKNFIWRGLQQPNALAHHVVGAGKTYAGIALALEKRRMGLARKPLVVVPNHLTQQWARDVLKLYPAARVLASTKKDFEPGNRKRFLNRIATGDWDVVVVPYSHYGLIKTSDETFNAFLQKELDGLEEELQRARRDAGKNDPSVKELEKAKLNLQAKLRNVKDSQKKDDTITFEETGVDMLIVDEAHNFKRLFFPTKMTRVAGVPTGKGSQRAFDLFVKSRYLATANPTGGTVFLTGTPISNTTMAEMFVLMRYLAQPMLDQRGIPQFDGWAATFGERVSAFEISPTGRGFRQKTRFSRFTNMPELMQMYRSFADVQTADMLKLPTPPLKGGKAQLHVIPASTELNGYVDTLLDRYEAVLGKNGKQKPDPRVDNPLKITTDGRKAALDLRLVGLHQPEGGKIDESGQQIFDIWKRETHRKGTQLVFADLGAPNEKEDATKFTVYDALRERLVELGIPKAEIKFIHEAKTDAQKQALFESVRAGDVRVLMGSTEKMGAGTNVQDRLVALHHLDAPWRPSDIEQREGRILRQGNLFGDAELKSPEYDKHFAVEIHTYLSERSFDAYLWQLLESKARFITQAVKGDTTSREMDDADDIVMSFGAAKAIATGNSAIMEHAKAQSDLARLEISESNHTKRRWRLQKQVAELPEQIEGWERKERDAQTLLAAITLPAERKDFTVAVKGSALTGEAATAAIQKALDKSQNGPKHQVSSFVVSSEPVAVGTAAGVDVAVYTTTSFLTDKPQVTQFWRVQTGDAVLSKPATIGTGAMASLWHLLENQPQIDLIRARHELETLRSSLAAAQAEVDKPFAQAKTVKDLREKIKALEAALNLDAQSLAAEAAAAGTIVTTAEEDKADAAAERAQELAEEGGDVPDEDEAPAPAPKRPKGTTLQSTILPGAAEFGEHILEPALRVVAEELRKNRDDIVGLFAPDISTPHAVRAAGVMRANLSARDQRQQRARRSLRDVEKAMDAWSHDKSMQFWDAMEGVRELDTLDDDTRAIAELYRAILDRYRGAILKRDLIRNYIENYWGHEWQRGGSTVEQAVRRLFGRRPIQGPESFRRKRSIPTMRDGIDLGLEPLSWNPTTQLLRKLHEMNKSIAWADMKRELKAMGEIKFVPANRKLPDGWTRLPDSLGVVYGPPTFKTASGEEARIPYGKLVAGYYAAPKEVVRLLANHMSPGLRGKSAAFDLYRTVGNFLNQLQLSFSFFHMMMTGMESVVSKQSLVFEQIARGHWTGAARSQVQVPIAPLVDVFRGHKNLKAFYAHDANAEALDDIVGQIVNAGGGFGWDLFEHASAPEAFMRHLRTAGGAAKEGAVGRALAEVTKAGLRSVPALVELTAKPIMEGWVPRLKIAAFLDLAAMELQTLGPEPDLEEARRVLGQVWDSIDNRFGELRYDNLFWNNALKDLGMGSVRALGWNIGTIRELFGVLPAQARQLGLGGGGGGIGKPPQRRVHTGADDEGEPTYAYQPESRLHRKTAWFLAMVLAYGLAGAIYMYLRTGKRPQELKDYFFPQNGDTDRNGKPVRVSIAGYFKDFYAVTHALPGSVIETAKHKLHPLLTLLADILGNEDFFGTEIRNADDPFVQQVADVMRYVVKESMPITVQNQSVESAFGITKAPATVTRTPLEQYLHDIRPPAHRTKEEATRAEQRRTLREAVRTTPPGTARPPVETDRLGKRSIRETVRSAHRSGLVFGVQRASFTQALKAYEIASPEERQDIRGAVARKLPAAIATTPAAERSALLGRYRAAMQLPAAKAAAGF